VYTVYYRQQLLLWPVGMSIAAVARLEIWLTWLPSSSLWLVGVFYSELIGITRSAADWMTAEVHIVYYSIVSQYLVAPASDWYWYWVCCCLPWLFIFSLPTRSLGYSTFLLTVLHVFCLQVKRVCNVILLCSSCSQYDAVKINLNYFFCY